MKGLKSCTTTFWWTLVFFSIVSPHSCQSAKLSVSECRERGFDSSNLACATCDLLPLYPLEHQASCLKCCQSFRDVDMIQKPYEKAILVTAGRQAGEEIAKLLQDDWDGLVAEKGKDRLQMIESPGLTGNHFYFSAAPSFIFFFDNLQAVSSSTSIESLEKAAAETILLKGWKREDMKDMLQVLLP